MPKALYYPHTDVTNSTIVKNALLLWDSLETIVPRAGWIPKRTSDVALNEAIDHVVRPRIPSAKQRADAHKELNKLVDSGQLNALLSEAPRRWGDRRYLIYPEKFLAETWWRLEESGLAAFDAASSDYGVPPALGYLMMSLLADSCAGSQIQKVTDRTDAYSWLAQTRAKALGSTHVTGLDASQVAPAYDRLITISLEVLDARNVPINKLLEFRKREARGNGADYRAMRHKYAQALAVHIGRVTKEAKTAKDLLEIESQFRTELERDLVDLKAELQLASLKTLFSKEVAISAIATAGSLTSPIPGLTELSTQIGLLGIIPLLKSAVELRGARRSALQKHTSSWLYLASSRRLQLR